MAEEQTFKEHLESHHLAQDTIEKLISYGFVSLEHLNSLKLEHIPKLKLTPLAQVCILEDYIKKRDMPKSTISSSHDLPKLTEGGVPIQAYLNGPPASPIGMLNSEERREDGGPPVTTVQGATAAISPLVYLDPKRKGEGALKIKDFVDKPSDKSKKQSFVINADGQLVSTNQQTEHISITDWGIANARILASQLNAGKVASTQGVLEYLAYTVKTLQLAKTYEWSGVLEMDSEYRDAQHSSGFTWGSDLTHLEKIHLKPRLIPTKSNAKLHVRICFKSR